MRTQWIESLLTIAVVFGLISLSSAQVTKEQEDQRMNMESHIGKLNGHAGAGKDDYRRYCVGCHGDIGDGNGENAQWLDPKPRDFTLGVFKCRSTPTGTLPTDEDLYNTIARGLDRSNMPVWNTFGKQERADLVAYVKHFSPRFVSEKPGAPIEVPAEPEITADRIKAGRDLFQKLECWKCHGVTGRANGPSASTLTDDQSRPILPFNFTEGTRFKCGVTDADLYKIFMTGLDGTPMPSFSDNVKPEEAWELVFYLRTLEPIKSREKEVAKGLNLPPISTH